MRCCFNVRSKADRSQLNRPNGTKNYKVEKRKTKREEVSGIGEQSG